jgi:RNA polymerase sigma-70 factor (ECF subfamily)
LNLSGNHPSQDRDADLLRLVALGDQAALSELITRFGHGMIVLATRYLGQQDEAEDVVQDVWLRVWKTANRFDAQRGKAKTWIYRITTNLCIDRLRRLRLRQMIGLAQVCIEPVDTISNPEKQHQDSEALKRVQAAFNKLPDRQRMALLLTVAGGLDAEQVASTLGTSRGGAEQLIARARRKLRNSVYPEDIPK